MTDGELKKDFLPKTLVESISNLSAFLQGLRLKDFL